MPTFLVLHNDWSNIKKTVVGGGQANVNSVFEYAASLKWWIRIKLIIKYWSFFKRIFFRYYNLVYHISFNYLIYEAFTKKVYTKINRLNPITPEEF